MAKFKYALLLFVIIISSFLMINIAKALPDLAIENIIVRPSHPPANEEVYILLTVKNKGSSEVPAADEGGQFNFGIKEIKYLDNGTVVALDQSARSDLADDFAVDETKILVIKRIVTKSQNISLCIDCTNRLGEMGQYPNEANIIVYLDGEDPGGERCVKGETFCRDNYTWTCNYVLKTRFDRSDQPCTYGCDEDLATGRLAMCRLCNEGDLKCDTDGNIKKCGPNGRTWDLNTTCNYTCSDSKCQQRPASPICTAGAFNCSGSKLMQCVDNGFKWEPIRDCGVPGCEDGACIIINQPPEITNVSPEEKAVLTVGAPFLFSVTATDPEGEALNYSWDLGVRTVPWGYITTDSSLNIICKKTGGTTNCPYDRSIYLGEVTASLGNACTCTGEIYPKRTGRSFLYTYGNINVCTEPGERETNKCKITVTATDSAKNSVSETVTITLKSPAAVNPCAAYSNSHACTSADQNSSKISGTDCCCGQGFKPLVNLVTFSKQCSKLTCADNYPNTHSCSANETNKLSGTDCCCNADYNILDVTAIGAAAGQLPKCMPAGCVNDAQCETGESCINSICKSTKCERDSDCGYFKVCQNGTCINYALPEETNETLDAGGGEEGAGLEGEEALEGEGERELCGDAYCDLTLGENSINCMKDCHCGDKTCQAEYFETANSCPSDCKKTPVVLIIVLILVFIVGAGLYLAYAKGWLEFKKGGKDTSDSLLEKGWRKEGYPRAFSEAEGEIEPPKALAVKHNVSTPSDSTVSLKNYIKASRAQGFSYTQIKSSLLKKGWKEETINKLFGEMA